MRVLQIVAGVLVILAGCLTAYAFDGYRDAIEKAPDLARRADRLIAAGRGPDALGPGRFALLLRVQDPNFLKHNGMDGTAPGAGLTTMTQSLSKRLAFTRFRPGIGKIRQSAYALGLERKLTKAQIAALWIDTVELGRGPRGWMIGFFPASREVFGRTPAALSQRQFLAMVAVLIAPGQLRLAQPDARLRERIGRIERLLAGRCRPLGARDVWLRGCADRPARVLAPAQ